MAEKLAQVISLASTSTAKCYQWIQALSRLPRTNPPLAKTHRVVKAQTSSCPAQEQLNSDSLPPDEDVTTVYKPPLEKQFPAKPPTQETAFPCLMPLHYLRKVPAAHKETQSRKWPALGARMWHAAGDDGVNRIIASWEVCLPLVCCLRLPYPNSTKFKGRLLSPKK